MIDVTDPLKPTAWRQRWSERRVTLPSSTLSTDVSAVQIGGHHYALVASALTWVRQSNGALVIVNITDPDSLSHVWSGRAGFGHTSRLQRM